MYYYYNYYGKYSYVEAIIFAPNKPCYYGANLVFNNVNFIKIFKSHLYQIVNGSMVTKKYCKPIDEPNNILKNLV